jgi:hypothetical protein
MQLLTPTEEKMWEKTPSLNHITMSDQEINDKYEKANHHADSLNSYQLKRYFSNLK